MDSRTKKNCRIWQFRTYDVYGNENDGYDVNDVISCGIYILENEKKEGTVKAWKKAIRYSVFNEKRVYFDIEWLDSDMIEITMRKDGYPVGRFEIIDDFDADSRWIGKSWYTLPDIWKVSGNRAYRIQ